MFKNDSISDEILAAITEVATRLARVEGELAGRKEELALTKDLVLLKKQISDLEVSKSKKEEEFSRKERETLHMVGLEKKRQEFEIDQAKRETTVTVREENLSADRQRFTEQMEFHKDQIAGEIDRFEGLLKALLERLPSVEVKGEVAAPTRRKAA